MQKIPRFWRIGLKVTKEELARIEDYVAQAAQTKPSGTCVGLSCGAITKNSDILIPFPVSKMPSWMAGYLTLAKRLGYSRISEMTYIGREKGTWLSGETVAENVILAGVPSAVGYLLFQVYEEQKAL